MKKKVLLSVFAASLFAAAPAALAQEAAPLLPIGNGEGSTYVTNPKDPAANILEFKKSYDEGLEGKAVKETEKANGLKAVKTDDGYKLVGKGQAAKKAMAPKAGAKPAGKVLPKTSAAK